MLQNAQNGLMRRFKLFWALVAEIPVQKSLETGKHFGTKSNKRSLVKNHSLGWVKKIAFRPRKAVNLIKQSLRQKVRWTN